LLTQVPVMERGEVKPKTLPHYTVLYAAIDQALAQTLLLAQGKGDR